MHELGRVAGNLKNHTSAVACILAREYLEREHSLERYDACAKLQGAKGLDIDCLLTTGERVVGEVKTTIPYKQTQLGAAQQTSFKKDLQTLTDTLASWKYFFVVDQYAYQEARKLLVKQKYDPSINIVDLLAET